MVGIYPVHMLKMSTFMPIRVLIVAFVSMLATASQAQQILSRSQLEDFGQSLGVAPTVVPRPLPGLAIGLIKDFEGWQPKAYDDPVGLCTIGYGHLIGMKKCAELDLGAFPTTLSPERGEQLLELDTRTSRAAVHSLVKRELTHDQFGALSSFAFNVGKNNFATSTLLKLVNTGEDKYAQVEFLRWVKAKGKVFKGLQDRRACEAALFSGALKGNSNGKFNRAECISLGIAPGTADLIDVEVGEKK